MGPEDRDASSAIANLEGISGLVRLLDEPSFSSPSCLKKVLVTSVFVILEAIDVGSDQIPGIAD